MQHDQGSDNPPDPPPPVGVSGGRPQHADDASPPRLLFWRHGRRGGAAEPPPPIWELPEMPTLWTRLKQQARQQADRWLGDRAGMRGRDETPSAASQDAEHAAPRTTRREDTASLRPPAAASPGEGRDISSEVLEYAYEAVRQGRITDPDTIRQLAARFAQLAGDDESGSDLGFDPQEAVRRLRQRAAEIAQRRGLRDEEQEDPPPTQNGEGSSARGSGASGSPRRAMPQEERDENITRGG